METCAIKTPDPHIDESFRRIFDFLKTYCVDKAARDVRAPGVCGYGIDEVTPRCQDTRDNRGMVQKPHRGRAGYFFLSEGS